MLLFRPVLSQIPHFRSRLLGHHSRERTRAGGDEDIHLGLALGSDGKYKRVRVYPMSPYFLAFPCSYQTWAKTSSSPWKKSPNTTRPMIAGSLSTDGCGISLISRPNTLVVAKVSPGRQQCLKFRLTNTWGSHLEPCRSRCHSFVLVHTCTLHSTK